MSTVRFALLGIVAVGVATPPCTASEPPIEEIVERVCAADSLLQGISGTELHETVFGEEVVDGDTINAVMRSMCSTVRAGSTPRSKRWPASVAKLKRRERPATASGHQNAAST